MNEVKRQLGIANIVQKQMKLPKMKKERKEQNKKHISNMWYNIK